MWRSLSCNIASAELGPMSSSDKSNECESNHDVRVT